MRYDLRVLAAALTIVPLCVYVLGHASPGTLRTLSWLDGPSPWALLLTVEGIIAFALSWWSPRAGLLIVMWSAGVWVAFLGFGLAVNGFAWSAIGSAGFYVVLTERAGRALQE